jgi:hypothetical protein
VDCYAGPPQRVHPVHRRTTNDAPDLVGNKGDYVAETKDKTFWAGGNFLDVSVGSEQSDGVEFTGDAGILGPNEYTLQINTNDWGTTFACGGTLSPGSTFHPGCHVWQQFVYATDYVCFPYLCTAGVFIQSWLINYGECPDGWNQSNRSGEENCYVNSNVVLAPDFPISDLGKLSLHASAKPEGQDCTTVYDDTGAGWGVCQSDGILDISSVWDKTEFGIFGDGGDSEASFSFGTHFAVLLQVNDGSGAAPTCLGPANVGTTGEINNLTLGKPCEPLVGNGLYPRIRFTESNPFSPPPPPNLCGQIQPGQGLTPGEAWHSCDGRFSLFMQTDGNLVLYEKDTDNENDTPNALWATCTMGQDVAFMIMQADGNLVLYNTSEGASWNSGTSGYEGAYLVLGNEGTLSIDYPVGQTIWTANTWCH